MSALTLKVIACICMLLDHVGFCVPELFVFRLIGRLAFPLYVFLLTEGFRHTSSRPRYALRLLLFAGIAQPAFGFFVQKDVFYPEGSVMVTLFAAYLCLWVMELCRKNRFLLCLGWLFALGLCAVLHLEIIRSDYGAKGILLALTFYRLHPAADRSIFAEKKALLLPLLLCAFLCIFYQSILANAVVLIRAVSGVRPEWILPDAWAGTQAVSLFAIPLTLLYNGERGWTPKSRFGRKALQYCFYLFYPVHMVILGWTIR